MVHLRASFFSLCMAVAAILCTGQANPGFFAKGVAPSPWLEKAAPRGKPRQPGCWRQPWVCQEGRTSFFFSPFGRKMCCNDRCIDVSSDGNNCGACGVRCPFSWTCCNGVCVDPKSNPFHCGGCNKQCAFGSACSYGMCGYAQQPQPQPFPGIPFYHPQPCKHSPAPPSPQTGRQRRYAQP